MARVARAALARLVALVALAALTAAPAAAQEPRGLTFVGGLAYEDGGPGPSLVDALAEAGLDHERSRSCAPGAPCLPTEHPFHFTEGLKVAGMIGARYRFERPFSIEGLISNGQRGHAEGYNGDAQEHVIVGHSSFLFTTTGGYHVGPVRLELGPTVNFTNWRLTRNSADVRERSTTAIGATAGVSVGIRARAVLVSLRSGVRTFPTTDLSQTLNAPLESDYRSFFVGVHILPWTD